MTELQQSYVRSLAKFVGGLLVAKGVIDGVDVVTLSAMLETLIGAGVTLYGLWKSHQKHA